MLYSGVYISEGIPMTSAKPNGDIRYFVYNFYYFRIPEMVVYILSKINDRSVTKDEMILRGLPVKLVVDGNLVKVVIGENTAYKSFGILHIIDKLTLQDQGNTYYHFRKFN